MTRLSREYFSPTTLICSNLTNPGPSGVYCLRPKPLRMDGEITAAELEAALEDGDAPLVVDIRSPHEYQREHIEDSINVPLGELPQKIETVADADHVVTVCPHGKASVRAANLITSFEGFEGRVESLGCGLTGWEGPVDSTLDDTGESADAPF